MPRDGAGNYSLPESPFVADTVIESAPVNSNLSDIATALTGSLAADGQKAMSGALQMGGYKITGLAAGNANGDAVRYEQLAETLERMGYQNFVTVYGAVGDGVTNNTTAWQNACNAGLPLLIPPGDFLIQGAGTIDTDGMVIKGVGAQSILRPSGSFNLMAITNCDGARVEDLHFEAAAHTGYLVHLSGGADRVTWANCTAISPYNSFYAEEFNTVTLRDLWIYGHRGAYMFHLYGTPLLRSDVIEFSNVVASADPAVAAGSRAVGLMWDGNVHTVSTNSLLFVIPLRGLHMRATAGGASFPDETPSFGRFNNLQIDFPSLEGVLLDSAWEVEFVQPYIANSLAEEGMNIGSSAHMGSIVGGFINGHPKEGLVYGGKDWEFSGVKFCVNSFVTANLGSYDHVRCTSTAERGKFAGCHAGLREGVGEVTRYGLRLDSGASYISWSGGYLGGLQDAWSDASGSSTNSNFEVTAVGARLAVIDNHLIGTAVGFGATATATIGGGIISSVSVTAGGQHYVTAPAVFAYDPNGTGSGFTGTAVVNTAGAVTSVSVGAGGTGYSSATIIYFIAVDGTPTIRPYASSANVSQQIAGKGTGSVIMRNDNGTIFVAAGGTNTVNYVNVQPATTGNNPEISAQGDDTNIDLNIAPKGTGVINLGGPVRATAGAIAGYLDIEISGSSYCIPYYARS